MRENMNVQLTLHFCLIHTILALNNVVITTNDFLWNIDRRWYREATSMFPCAVIWHKSLI